MLKDSSADTITAIATPQGESGIGIIRINGPRALAIADKIFVSKDGRMPSEFKTYTTHYGWVVDEVILTIMRAPRSYTKEDIVEINCHGGIIPLRKVLSLVLKNGARLAEPGEFTKRAFLNGRIDLAQAEAVLDIIRSKTDSALEVGIEQLKGGLSKEINRIREILLDALSVSEAKIDFPDEDTGEENLRDIGEKLNTCGTKLKTLLENSRLGRVLREGIHAVICGKPNVGKSSLLNALLREERSIVTPVAGTTRDTIEEVIDIKGIPVRITDTAGILKPRGLVEKKAVARSKKYIEKADLVILLFDASKKVSQEDKSLMKKLCRRNTIAVINKIDLNQKIEKERISRVFKRIIEISAKKGKYIHLLEDAIVDLVYAGRVKSKESPIVSNMRHIETLRSAQKLLAAAVNSLDNSLSLEFISQDIKDTLGLLDEIVGRKFSEDLLDKIFNNFCIGK